MDQILRTWDAKIQIENACNQGNQVINLSASAGGTPMQFQYPELQNTLAQKGCILIEASGNSGPSPEYITKNQNQGQPFVTVGASDAAGNTPRFSTPGTLRAPGVGLVLSNRLDQSNPHSGTSFATPIATAVTKNIYAILNVSAEFQNLENVKKVALVQKVLVDSAQANGINKDVDGYRAVLLANYVRKQGAINYLNGRASVSMAMAAAKVPPISEICSASQDCDRVRVCYEQKRQYFAANPDKATPSGFTDLLHTAQFAGESALTSQWAAKPQGNLPPTPVASYDNGHRAN